MSRIAIIVAVVAIALAATVDARRHPRWNQLDEKYTFERFVADFGRRYERGSAKWNERKSIYDANLKTILAHNRDTTQSYKKGINQFTDMSYDEWRQYNRYAKDSRLPKPNVLHTVEANPEIIPRTVDWRVSEPRVLTGIKNQGACGNCWAHASTESLESYFALATGQLPVLSTQQITSCTAFLDGCGGGDSVGGWIYVNTTDGLATEWAYPFVDIFVPNMTKGVTAKCKNIENEFPKHFDWFNALTEVGVLGYGSVSPPNKNTPAMSGLAKVGPMAISVAAAAWKDYESGIYTNTGTSTDWEIDHAVQMVGYGFDRDLGKDYWIVRNSWGTLWGEDGFIRLDKPATEPCGPGGAPCGTSGCLNGLNYPQVQELPAKHF